MYVAHLMSNANHFLMLYKLCQNQVCEYRLGRGWILWIRMNLKWLLNSYGESIMKMRFYYENEMAANEILRKLAYLYSEKYPRNYHRL